MCRSPLHRAALVSLLVVTVGFDLAATGWLSSNERLVAMCRNVVFPGLGFIETSWWLAVAFAGIGVAAVAAWLRWGMDWIVAVVWAAGIAVAFVTVPVDHTHDVATATATATAEWRVLRASHEFAAVLVLLAALSRARVGVAGLPGARRLTRRRADEAADRATALRTAAPVERCRAVAIAALALHGRHPTPVHDATTAGADAPDVRRRASRVAAAARWRFRGDPLRHDNAHAHAALALSGHGAPEQLDALRALARTSPYGVPASEPTWVRLLDGTLAALAVEAIGEPETADRWRATLAGDLRLRHGRRARAIHVPTSLRLATAPHWEHATATALARRRGWIDDGDWAALRQRSLGAAARGARRPDDARLVAAARIWAHLVADDAAARILDRPSRSGDPIAAALDDVLDVVVLGDDSERTTGAPTPGRAPHLRTKGADA
jgi:hypothetical protein